MKNKKNVVLTGMPGCGKSTIGVQLAKWLGYDFLDTDLLISGTYHKPLYKIIEDIGASEFLKIENEIISKISVSETVIATGGSVVYGRDAMERLKEIGSVYYLKVPVKEISLRIGDMEMRGVVSKTRGLSLDEVFYERSRLYEEYADVEVDLSDTNPLTAAKKVYDIIVL